MGQKRNAYGVLVGKPERKRPLWRSGRRWEDNIKINHRAIVWGDMDGFLWLRIGTSGELL
jgi:hypothetical protein